MHLVVAKILLSKREKAVKDAVCACARSSTANRRTWFRTSGTRTPARDCRWSTMDRGRYSDTCFPGGIKSGHCNGFIQPKMADDVW